MKEKIKSMGVWFKENFKRKKKVTLEEIKELIWQEFNYDRMNLEKVRIKLETKEEEIKNTYEYAKLMQSDKFELQKEINSLNQKIAKLEKDTLIYKAENELLKKEQEDFKKTHWIVKEIPEGKTPKGQELGIKSGVRTGRIARKVKEGKN